jgi:soluble lytic murein transglycosylase
MGIAASYPKVYYGQMAARHMRGKLAPVSPIPAVASAEDTNKIRNSDLGRAIRIMDEAGMNGIRNKMIASLTDSLNTGGEHKALAKMLTGMGLKAEALKVAKKASGKNFFLKEEAYPTVRELFQGLNVDVALAHALIRQESQFDPQIRSPAGAMGLMQVMPSTAAEVAAKRGWQHDKIWMTTQPKQNVLIGSAYLNDLLDRFGGSYPLALAAYNGGPRRVNEWLAEFGDPRKGGIDWVDWIEMIPVYETRNYVQRVMENYVVYKEHMKL